MSEEKKEGEGPVARRIRENRPVNAAIEELHDYITKVVWLESGTDGDELEKHIEQIGECIKRRLRVLLPPIIQERREARSGSGGA